MWDKRSETLLVVPIAIDILSEPLFEATIGNCPPKSRSLDTVLKSNLSHG
jgi:hypothetical protein